MTDNNADRRARHLDAYDHTHTTDGHHIPDVGAGLQDANDRTECCGRTVPRGPDGEQPWKHARGCTNYRPHPDSIAAQGAPAA